MPLPSQVPLWETDAPYVLWGGQAGPGKTTGGRRWLYHRALTTEGYTGLLLRENWEQLEKTHLREMEREVPALGGKFYKSDRKVEFGTSVIDCGHMAEAEAVYRYLSTEYTDIVGDEASQYPLMGDGVTVLAELSTRARRWGVHRKTGTRVKPRQVWLTNPGGPSSDYLCRMCIDHEPDYETYPALAGVYRPEEWVYLEAKLDDNPYADESYRARLAVLSGVRYEQQAHGDWHIRTGQFFSEFKKSLHVRALLETAAS